MKYTLASILSGVLLAAASATSHAAQAIPDDPELVAWMQSANDAQRARLEQLAASDDARSKLMAMQLVHPVFPLRDHPEEEIAAEQARGWSLLEEAAAADPDDFLVAWRMATCLPASALDDCGSADARQRLESAGGERAAVQLWLADSARQRGDDDAAEVHLQAAAEAQTLGAPEKMEEALIWEALTGIEVPEPSDDVARAYAQRFGVHPDAVLEQVVGISAVARIVALPTLGLQPVMEGCDPAGMASAAEGRRRQQCLSILTLMADQASSSIHRLVAEPRMVELALEASALDTWRERLRTTMWIYETATPLQMAITTSEQSRYFETWRQSGEWEAMRGLLMENGLSTEPAEGWLPEAARMRALIVGEGQGAHSAPLGAGPD